MQSTATLDDASLPSPMTGASPAAPARAAARGSWLGFSLVAISILASTFPPALIWFNPDHANSPGWHEHAKFHIVWNACLFLAMGALAVAALAAFWNREAKVRLVLAVLPIVIALTYFFAGLVLAPRMGITEPFREATPLIFWGINIKLGGWVVLMLAASGGYLLDRRARSR